MFFIDFGVKVRWEEREKEGGKGRGGRERERDQSVASHMCTSQESNPQPFSIQVAPN